MPGAASPAGGAPGGGTALTGAFASVTEPDAGGGMGPVFGAAGVTATCVGGSPPTPSNTRSSSVRSPCGPANTALRASTVCSVHAGADSGASPCFWAPQTISRSSARVRAT